MAHLQVFRQVKNKRDVYYEMDVVAIGQSQVARGWCKGPILKFVMITSSSRYGIGKEKSEFFAKKKLGAVG